MSLLRIMLSTLVLLVQAWPAFAVMPASDPDSSSCTMGCCEAVAEIEMTLCGCVEESLPAAPASTPPASGRDLVPQVTWVAVDSTPILGRPAYDIAQTGVRSTERDAIAQPHVRLPVLFCSFLN